MPKYRFVHQFTAQGHVFHAPGRLRKLRADGASVPPQVLAVFMAFSVEAYINSVGSRVLPFWDEVERNSWKSKLNILHASVERQADYGAQPLQFAAELFRFRDKFAHGKPETWNGAVFESEAEPDLMGDLVNDKPAWYATIDDAWADASVDKNKQLLIYIGQLGGFGETDHMHHSSGTVEEVG